MGNRKGRSSGDNRIVVNHYSEHRIELLKLVLRYEAGLMGGTSGQALRKLVMRYAGRARLPKDVRLRLKEIARTREQSAVVAAYDGAAELDATA